MASQATATARPAGEQDFLDLVLAEPDWLEAEFNAIIADWDDGPVRDRPRAPVFSCPGWEPQETGGFSPHFGSRERGPPESTK